MFSFDDGRNKLCCVAFREFLKGLALFSKPLVAGVHGAAVGLGVTMLPFFDMVFASDKATFYTPYAKLGQVPEGAAILTLPHMLGNAVVSTNAHLSCRVYFYVCCIKFFVFFLYSSSCKIILSVGCAFNAIFYGSQALTHVENEPPSSSESDVHNKKRHYRYIYCGVSSCGGSFYDDSLLQPLPSQAEHS